MIALSIVALSCRVPGGAKRIALSHTKIWFRRFCARQLPLMVTASSSCLLLMVARSWSSSPVLTSVRARSWFFFASEPSAEGPQNFSASRDGFKEPVPATPQWMHTMPWPSGSSNSDSRCSHSSQTCSDLGRAALAARISSCCGVDPPRVSSSTSR